MKIREKPLITDHAFMTEIAQKTKQVSGFRRFSVSVMAADRIMTDVVNLKTAKSRRESLDKSVLCMFIYLYLCLYWWGGDWTDWFVVDTLVGLCVCVGVCMCAHHMLQVPIRDEDSGR